MADPPPDSVHPLSRDAWRAWLGEHHEHDDGVWFVRYKKATGKPSVSYDEAVDEAICFGWIDSLPRSLDAERSMLYFAPRTPGSGWSRVNKARVTRMTEAGQMTPAGQAKIDAAIADGSWYALDDVENLVVPDDLTAAFDAYPRRGGALGDLSSLGEARHPRMDRGCEKGRDAREAGGRDGPARAAERARQSVDAEVVQATPPAT